LYGGISQPADFPEVFPPLGLSSKRMQGNCEAFQDKSFVKDTTKKYFVKRKMERNLGEVMI
jgi:hypothetical protein